MPNQPSHYGISSPGGVPSMQGHLGYDSYVEMAQTRAAMQKSVALQGVQTLLLGNMAGTLKVISNEMAQMRRASQDALAVQQALLTREVLQQRLEEMIFQGDKLVAECANPKTEIPASSQFFLLEGFLKTVERGNIGTAIIRGRDNKTAFERVIQQASGLTQRLLKEPEVQEALAWAKKLEDQRHRQRQQIEQKAAPLRRNLSPCRSSAGVRCHYGMWRTT